ncbi:MAG: two-component system LytT family response regulator [Flavobacteriales bacterium]|jgi:two-component system LytT family response regulator
MNTVLIDDEPLALKSTFVLLQDYCPMLKVVGMARDIEEGREMLERLTPDLVICDIEMPGGSGFDLLDQFPKPSFQIIFITAYDHYAIKAFKYSVIDYLLKPFTKDKLVEAIEKAKVHKRLIDYTERMEALIENQNQLETLILSDYSGSYAIPFNQLIYLKAEGNYTQLYCEKGKRHTCSKLLKFYQGQLCEDQFFRVHHSIMIQRCFINYFDSKKGKVIMTEGQVLSVSQRKAKAFIAWLNQ